MEKNKTFSTKTLTTCALLTAMAVVLARFVAITPSETTRISFEAVPIFLSGMLFGPLAGMLVGFTSDFIGALMSFGFNPILCLPPIIYGLCGGLFRPMLWKAIELWRVALAFLPAVVLGSWLWQSCALALAFGGETKFAFFMTKIVERGIQFSIIYVLDVLIIYGLCRSNLFRVAGLQRKGEVL